MQYVALVGDQERQVEVAELSAARYRITIDGNSCEIDAHEISPTTLSVLHDSEVYNVEFEDGHNGCSNLLLRGQTVSLEMLDLRKLRLRKAQAVAATGDGPAVVASPMPGRVVAVLVKEGEQVEEGQGVIVVEAMKMENELRAPQAGTVRDLSPAEGDTVEGGAALCVID